MLARFLHYIYCLFIRTKKRKNGKAAVQIVESYRRGDKVSPKIVRHSGQGVSEHEIEALTALANTIIAEIEEQRQPSLPFFEPEKLTKIHKKRSKVEDHVPLNNLKEVVLLTELAMFSVNCTLTWALIIFSQAREKKNIFFLGIRS